MKYEVIILGTSSALPTAERFPSAQILNFREKHFLIDAGEGTQIQMRKYRQSFQRIQKIFISHLHADHFLGLPGLLSSMSLLGRENLLEIYGPEGIKTFLETTFRISDAYLTFPVEYIATDPKTPRLLYEDEHMCIESFPLFHRIACTGFLFREKEKARKFDKKLLNRYFLTPEEIIRIKNGADYLAPDGNFFPNREITIDPPPAHSYAYCSDTAPFPELASYIQGIHTLYHEATFTGKHAARAKETRHSTALQAAELARDAGVSKLILGHFSTRYTDLQVFLDEACPVFARTSLAAEGSILEI